MAWRMAAIATAKHPRRAASCSPAAKVLAATAVLPLLVTAYLAIRLRQRWQA